jgi:hypothetical protein
MDEVAFVAHRRSGRLVVRGTLAGHYLDAEQNGDVIGPYTGAGALTGALADAILGAAEVRDSVPERSSALMLLAGGPPCRRDDRHFPWHRAARGDTEHALRRRDGDARGRPRRRAARLDP